MSYTDSKKAVLATYEILKKYSTEEHPLSNLKIQEHLKNDYELNVSRNTIKDTLAKLQELYGYDIICWKETMRSKSDDQENTYTFSYYFNRNMSADILSDEDIAIRTMFFGG